VVLAGGLNGAGEPKVGHQRVTLAHKNIFGLDVTMHDAVAMGVAQRVSDFAGNLQGLRNGQLAFAANPIT
jgi:hypothetical protein